MKINDINKKFTEKVSEYLAKGYVINVRSMSGSQGEEGKVDLVKGDELIRIWMNYEHSEHWLEDGAWSDYMMVIRVGKWIHPAHKAQDSWATVWMRDLEIIEEISYYEIAQNKWYTNDAIEAMALVEKRRARRRAKGYSWDKESPKDLTNPTTQEIASRFLKRMGHYQRVCQSDIMVRKYVKANTYRIFYHDHNYNLH